MRGNFDVLVSPTNKVDEIRGVVLNTGAVLVTVTVNGNETRLITVVSTILTLIIPKAVKEIGATSNNEFEFLN